MKSVKSKTCSLPVFSPYCRAGFAEFWGGHISWERDSRERVGLSRQNLRSPGRPQAERALLGFPASQLSDWLMGHTSQLSDWLMDHTFRVKGLWLVNAPEPKPVLWPDTWLRFWTGIRGCVTLFFLPKSPKERGYFLHNRIENWDTTCRCGYPVWRPPAAWDNWALHLWLTPSEDERGCQVYAEI